MRLFRTVRLIRRIRYLDTPADDTMNLNKTLQTEYNLKISEVGLFNPTGGHPCRLHNEYEQNSLNGVKPENILSGIV